MIKIIVEERKSLKRAVKEIFMKEEKILINDYIERLESKLYFLYKSNKKNNGVFHEKTDEAYKNWKALLEFIYEFNVDGTFNLKELKDAIESLGKKLLLFETDKIFLDYWVRINRIYYHILDEIKYDERRN